jgi:hypothetical protein
MKLDSFILRKRFVVGLALLVLLALGSDSYAKTIKYKSSGAGTFVTTNFSYDSVAPASILTASDKDNLGGAGTFQCVSEFVATATACTAPDSTAGTTFNLVQSDCAGQYTQGSLQFSQTYSTAAGAAGGTQCVSNTTGSFGGTSNYTVTGGAGKLTGASSSFTVTYTGNTLAAPGTPPGTNGLFGANTFAATGSITK